MRLPIVLFATISHLMAQNGATAAPLTFVVDSVGDGGDVSIGDGVCDDGTGDCTLRAAIEEANAIIGPDIVSFDILPHGDIHTIQPQSDLPDITDPIRIDGYTQPGSKPATNVAPASLKIVLDGSAAAAAGPAPLWWRGESLGSA